MDIIFMSFKVIGILIVFILLMLITLKLSENKISTINNKRNIKILDKAQLSKDVTIQIVKIAGKGYIMSVSASKAELIKELSTEEVNKIESIKEEQLKRSNEVVNGIFNNFTASLNKLKKRKNNYEK